MPEALPADEADAIRPAEHAPAGRRGARLLAAAIGLLGIVAITFFVHWYEVVLFEMGTRQVVVNALTPIVFFFGLLLVGAVNPLLHRLAPHLRLRRRELWGILAVWLLAGVIGYQGLGQPVLQTIGSVRYPAIETSMMKRVGFVARQRPGLYLPPDAARTYAYGLSDGLTRVSLARIPWRQWFGPLAFWAPFMIVVIVFSSSLVQMVHRQWSQHELLTYPIAAFAESYLGHEPDRAFPRVFYDRVFWIGFAVVGLIYVVNGLNAWFPLMIKIPLTFAHYDLIREFPFLNKYCGREAYSLFRGMVYPFAVALAVLLPAEVSLTCWLGWVLSIVAIGACFLVTGQVVGPTETGHIQCGMYVAMFVMIVAIGRREYASILRHAFTFRRPHDEVLHRAVVACRVFVLAFAALVGLLTVAGLDWLVAFVLVCAFGLVTLLIARMTAELGIPWLVSFTGMARSLPLKLLGSAAVGPTGLAVLAVVGAVLDMNTENTIAAQETTLRKLEEGVAAPSGWLRRNAVLALGVAAALAATVVFTLWDNYSFGAQKERRGIAGTMNQASAQINLLKIEGKAEALDHLAGLRKLAKARAEEGFWPYFAFGAAAIAAIALLRLRFAWWPFHPLPFLLIGTWCLSRLYFSFFLGWLIKVALLKIGGGKVFARAKPFFFGAIAGQIAAAGVWIGSGAIYAAWTGQQPPVFSFFY